MECQHVYGNSFIQEKQTLCELTGLVSKFVVRIPSSVALRLILKKKR